MTTKSWMAATVGLGLVLVAARSDVASAQANRTDPSFRANANRVVLQPKVGGETPNTGGENCASPPTQISTTPFVDSDNTCGNINDLTIYTGTCTLPFPYGGEDLIYRVDLGTGNNVGYTADLNGSTGDLALFLIGTCGDGNSCVVNSQDAIGPGVGPEIIAPAPRPNGDYYLYVDSYYDAGTPGSCGTYTLTVSGTLPVEMIDFSVK
jgi:hypothetical protein